MDPSRNIAVRFSSFRRREYSAASVPSPHASHVSASLSAPQFKQRGPFDLVLANILANPLRQMATPMSRHLAPGALVILSGLLPPQAGAVISAYRARGLVLKRHIQIEGWSSLLMCKAR